ncbi:hypothetical protein AAJCM20276_27150 [Acetobacter aceti]|uniref:Phage tail protein n=1 Tax=Acetobacter aceti TaxID=435 RepID=A0A6S6PN25_ACEAC|nr:hypothetical protein [Acetobacter aceti]BCI68091.1 hypothetical protein AAJCM20276_27150 [Acetobacter aceti]
MTDIAGVSTALAQAADAIIYPNGDSTASITGRRTIIRRGWITNDDYSGECSLQSGIDYVFVTALSGAFKPVACGLGMPWREISAIPATVSIETSGNSATVVFPAIGQASGIVGLHITPDEKGAIPARSVVGHVVTATDTPASVAAALATLIPGASSSGATVTIPHAASLHGAVGSYSDIARVTRRQQQLFNVSIWIGTWSARDDLGFAIDAGMSGDPFFPAPDGSMILVESAGSYDIDTMMQQGVWRRDLKFRCTFDTLQTDTAAQVLFTILNVDAPGDVSISLSDWPLNPL